MRIVRFKSVLMSALATVSLLVFTLSFLPANRASAVPNDLVLHDPIYIEGNDDFIPANGVTSGSGTAGDPYIIESWSINVREANGIEIKDTNAHFIIRNCNVHGVGTHTGIYFYNVKNGKIKNVVNDNNFHGIYFYDSSNNLIQNCVSENNVGKGI